MKGVLRLVACLLTVALAASPALGARVLRNGDRWPFGSPRAVALDTVNHLVFMARGNVLTTLDNNLSFHDALDLDNEILGICYSAGYIYAALNRGGFKIIAVDGLGNLSAMGTYEAGSTFASVFVNGSYAYITNIGNRFTVVDVSTPNAPSYEGSTTLPGLLVAAVNVYVEGHTAAVVDQVNGLHLLDVSHPDSPDWQSVTAIPGAFDVRLDGDYAYVASIAGGLDIVDISDLSDPDPRGSIAPADSYSVGIFVDGNTVWLADQINGLHEIDASSKSSPSITQTIAGTIGAYSVAVDGANVYVCDYEQGLQRVVGGANTYDPPAAAQDLFVDSDDYLYVVSEGAGGSPADEGLRILDAYNPGNIVYKGFIATPGQALGVCVAGDYAYVADGGSGLQVIDVSDKSNPVIVGSRDTAGSAQAVAVAGGYAYIADAGSGLQVIDVTVKANPGDVVNVNVPTGDAAYGVALAGSYAYVADGAAGLQVIDVSNPAVPAIVGTCDTPGDAFDVFVSGTIAYVADNTSGVQLIDVSVKTNPQIIGSYATGIANGIFVKGNTAYVADYANGLVSLDVSTPSAPTRINAWSTETMADPLNLHVAGDYVYMAEGLGGAAVYRLTDEDPFVPSTASGGGGGGCFIASLGF